MPEGKKAGKKEETLTEPYTGDKASLNANSVNLAKVTH
jgi:hypothetical protein